MGEPDYDLEAGAPQNHDGQTYEYDHEDRLVEVDVAGGEPVTFHYDAEGGRRARVINEGIPGQERMTRYFSDLVHTTDEGVTTRRYFLGGALIASRAVADVSWQMAAGPALGEAGSGVDIAAASWGGRPVLVVGLRAERAAALVVTVAVVTGTLPWAVVIAPEAAHSQTPPPPPAPGAADISYFHYDHLGSPLVISDGNGAAVEQIRYHPYGAVRARFDGNDQPIGAPQPEEIRYEFTGYEAERTTGLLYANARFYDPELGSFLTHDPAAEFWSPYTYVGWDPVNGTDPTGTCAFLCLVVVGFVVGFAASAINAAINGASFGEAMKAGLIGGAIGAVTAPIGAYVLKPALGGLIGGVTGVGTKTAGELASGILFVSGIGQSSYSASQNDFAGLIGIGLGLAAGAILAKGAQASKAAGSAGAKGFRDADGLRFLNDQFASADSGASVNDATPNGSFLVNQAGPDEITVYGQVGPLMQAAGSVLTITGLIISFIGFPAFATAGFIAFGASIGVAGTAINVAATSTNESLSLEQKIFRVGTSTLSQSPTPARLFPAGSLGRILGSGIGNRASLLQAIEFFAGAQNSSQGAPR